MTDPEFFLVPTEPDCPDLWIPLSRTTPTCLGRSTLTSLNIRSNENQKKLNVSRRQLVLTPYGMKSWYLKVLGINPIQLRGSQFGTVTNLHQGEVHIFRTDDTISLLSNTFTFRLVEILIPFDHEKFLPTTVPVPSFIPPAKDGQSGHYIKRKADEVDCVTIASKRPPGIVIPPLVVRTATSPKREGPPQKAASFIGKPVKFWDSERKTWMKGLVLMYNAAKAQALVDFEGEHQWKPANQLFLEETIMPIKEKDLKKSMKKKMQRGEKGKRKRGDERGSADRNTRSRRGVVYTEWISSSDESSGDEAPGDDPLSETEINGVKVQKKRAYPGETFIFQEQLADRPTAIFYSEECLKHFVPKWHYEKPERLNSIMEGLNDLVLKYPKQFKYVTDIKPLEKSDLALAHNLSYIDKVEKMVPVSDTPTHITQYTQESDPRDPEDDFDTFMSKDSMKAMLIATGAVRMGIDMVTSKEIRNGFCAIRPPGHHCGAKGHTDGATSQGYCIVNNVALGALYARNTHNYQRIAVVDFDVHHGNGTEELLGGKEGFLFISIHAGDIYPRTGYNNIPRESNVVNVGLDVGAGPQVFHTAFDSKIIPALKAYKPDLLLISAGFDAHKRDPTEGLSLEEKDYFIMTEKLKNIAETYCDGRLISVLEGGYHLPSLRKSVREHLISLIKK
eukprot:TRINITY_DN6895_c0_g1_i1.p1 TRINITY_DN6895_c0_g1~~TRINITY_DN6895_c0_g1_i1.p1  ORF type:complete len:675 (-),score=198.09 TRINITY_DN6895_c0_g1_i1:127-2151(-)